MFNGRYGADKLGFLLTGASIILTVVAALLRTENAVMRIILLAISTALVLFACFRVFSRDIRRRKRELRALYIAESKIMSLFGRHEDIPDDDTEETEPAHEEPPVSQVHDEFRHFKCPKCKKSLKVPAGKGYIKVVCPSCSYKFMRHT